VSFCGWLREFLPAADPSRTWEVMNAGGISYASYRVANLMEELARYQPDLFIVYSGHNEFLEERTYRNIIDMPKVLVRLNVFLARTRTYTAMSRVLEWVSGDSNSLSRAQARYELTGEVDEILHHTVGPTSYTRDDRLRKQIVAHYRFNLERMIHIARSAGSRILFVRPAANLKDMSPFKSEHRADLSNADRQRWAFHYQRGSALFDAGKSPEALAALQAAIAIDNRHAESYYRLGEVLFTLKRFDGAKEAFRRASDEDILPLRILTPMGEAVAEIAKRNRTPLIDFVALLEKNSAQEQGHTILGKEIFLDHVHLSLEGYRLLALALVEQMIQEGTVRPLPSWGNKTITAVTQRIEKTVDRRRQGIVLFNLGKVFDWAGKLAEGHDLFLRASNILGGSEVLARLGQSSVRMGKPQEAIGFYRRALQEDAGDAGAHWELAILLEKQGEATEAFEHFREAIRIKPNTAMLHNDLGYALTRQGRTKEALQHLTEALQIDPNLVIARRNLARLLSDTGRSEEAIINYQEVLKAEPEHVGTHVDLGSTLAAAGKLDQGISHFREALRLDPDSEDAHYNLGTALLHKQGKLDEAVFHFSKAMKLNPSSAAVHEKLGFALAMQGKTAQADRHLAEAQRLRRAFESRPPPTP
jgi:tetratricopeptide (TPR) repeat protein